MIVQFLVYIIAFVLDKISMFMILFAVFPMGFFYYNYLIYNGFALLFLFPKGHLKQKPRLFLSGIFTLLSVAVLVSDFSLRIIPLYIHDVLSFLFLIYLIYNVLKMKSQKKLVSGAIKGFLLPFLLTHCLFHFHSLLLFDHNQDVALGFVWGSKEDLCSESRGNIYDANLMIEKKLREVSMKGVFCGKLNEEFFADIGCPKLKRENKLPIDPFSWGRTFYNQNTYDIKRGYSGDYLKIYINEAAGFYVIWSVGPNLRSDLDEEFLAEIAKSGEIERIYEKEYQKDKGFSGDILLEGSLRPDDQDMPDEIAEEDSE